MSRLLKIDDLIRDQHSSLTEDDECYYLLEYTARKLSSHSRGNRLIINCKKTMDRQGRTEWRFKEEAIAEIARELRPGIASLFDFSSTTFIPVPPSKIIGHPMYDPRLQQILRLACGTTSDIRELIIAKKEMPASHESEYRPTVAELYSNYALNRAVSNAIHNNVVVFDDLITAGNHFKACKQFLNEYYHNLNITGIFVARRAIEASSPFDDFADFL